MSSVLTPKVLASASFASAMVRSPLTAVGGGIGLQYSQPLAHSSRALVRGRGGDPRLIAAQQDALTRAAGVEQAPRQLLALLGAAGQRLLGVLASLSHLAERAVDLVTALTRRGSRVLRLRQRGAARPRRVARQLPAGLERLALEPRVQLGCVGLPFERS